jgi:hypothetical protein
LRDCQRLHPTDVLTAKLPQMKRGLLSHQISRCAAKHAYDKIRALFDKGTIIKGHALRQPPLDSSERCT